MGIFEDIADLFQIETRQRLMRENLRLSQENREHVDQVMGRVAENVLTYIIEEDLPAYLREFVSLGEGEFLASNKSQKERVNWKEEGF